MYRQAAAGMRHAEQQPAWLHHLQDRTPQLNVRTKGSASSKVSPYFRSLAFPRTG
jgi:hypothetical protein